MKTSSLLAVCLLTFFSLPLFAVEVDFPDADKLFYEATQLALQRPAYHQPIEVILKQHLELRLVERSIEQGNYERLFEYLEKYQGTDKEKGQSERAYSAFVPIIGEAAFKSGDFSNLIKVLRYVPKNTHYPSYEWKRILDYMSRQDRLDEACLLYKEMFPEADDADQHIALQNRLYSVFQKGKDGLPAPKLESIFVQHTAYHNSNYRGRPLLDTIFHHSAVPDKVWEAVSLFKEKKEDEAKAVFDEVVTELSKRPQIMMSGMIGNTHNICGVAAFQIELGRNDWAKETLRKAETCHERSGKEMLGMGRIGYPVEALANIMVALGEIDAARKLIETDIPLRDDLGSPLTYCDLAVAYAKSGNKAAAEEILRNVLKLAETLDHPVVLRSFMNGLFDAVKRIGDKELCSEFLNQVFQKAETTESWSTRNDIFKPVVLAQYWLEDFDGAAKTLEKITLFHYVPHYSTFVDSLIKLKRYGELESFLRSSKAGDGRCRVPAWRAIAFAKYNDGDKTGAVEAINAAIYSAKNDPNGYTYGKPVLLIDIALDIKYSFSEKPGRAPVESIDEGIRWYRELIGRTSTDADDYTEEELLYLLRAYHAGGENKLQTMGESLYPFLLDAIFEPEKHHSLPGEMFRLIDVSKAMSNMSAAERQDLRKKTLRLHAGMPCLEFCHKVLSEVGQPEDVPQLLIWSEYVTAQIRPTIQTVSKIATAPQIPEIEKAIEEGKKLYFERFQKEEYVKHLDWATKHWYETLVPEFEKALQTIRERKG